MKFPGRDKSIPFASLLTQDNVVSVASLREADSVSPGKIENANEAKPGDVVLVGGIPFLIITDEEAETADAIMVSRRGPSPWKDNLFGKCAECRAEIMYRPHAPKTPRKICVECAEKAADKVLAGADAPDTALLAPSSETKPNNVKSGGIKPGGIKTGGKSGGTIFH